MSSVGKIKRRPEGRHTLETHFVAVPSLEAITHCQAHGAGVTVVANQRSIAT
jgi:hypothetical protein